MTSCRVCGGTGNVCPDCRNARYMKLIDREHQVDRNDYGPCPSCTHTLEGRLVQSKPMREARIRQYVLDREWVTLAPVPEPEPEPVPVRDDDDDDLWGDV